MQPMVFGIKAIELIASLLMRFIGELFYDAGGYFHQRCTDVLYLDQIMPLDSR